jgi:hypothetical protein
VKPIHAKAATNAPAKPARFMMVLSVLFFPKRVLIFHGR